MPLPTGQPLQQINKPQPGLVGLTNQAGGPSVVGGQGSIQPPPGNVQGPTSAPPVPGQAPAGPVPGVSGVTPGAVERRLAGIMSVPPSAQMNPGFGTPPSAQLQLGNTVGADPRNVQDPIMMIKALLARGGTQ